PEDIRTEKTGGNGNGYGHSHSEFQADGNVTAHRTVVSCPELLRHRNAEPSATTVAESQNEKNDRRTGSHGSQRINSQKLSDDCGIDKRICLLQQIAEQKRQCEL